MAVKVKNTVVNGGMSGGAPEIGKTFNHKSGQHFSTMKRYSSPTDKNSEAQQKVRNMFTQTSIGWSALTEAERNLWNDEAPSWVGTDALGTTTPSGKNLYTGCNVALVMADKVILRAPSRKSTVAELTNGYLASNGNANGLNLILEVAIPNSDDSVQISVSSQQTAGTSKCEKKSILHNQKLNDETNTDLTALYASKYGVLIAGSKIFYTTKQISLGGNTIKISNGFVIV